MFTTDPTPETPSKLGDLRDHGLSIYLELPQMPNRLALDLPSSPLLTTTIVVLDSVYKYSIGCLT